MNPGVDAYIEKSDGFARPILHHLRALVHAVCPEVVESIKWNFPNFEYRGAIICHMAAFKRHCTFGFSKGSLLDDPDGVLNPIGETAMGHLGRITSLSDLPSDDVLTKLIRQAIRLSEEKASSPKRKPSEEKALEIPDYFLQALELHPAAKAVFEKFSYTRRKDYLEWIREAKTDATCARRLQQAMEWISEGKGRNWKYEK